MMNAKLREFVRSCLMRFDRDDRLLLAFQRASAESRGERLSEMAIPPSCQMPRSRRTPCDLFDVELALMLFDRQQRSSGMH